MKPTRIIDGKAFAAGVRVRLAAKVAELKERHGVTPGLAVVLVGQDPASQVYVRNKERQTEEVGMNSFAHHMVATTAEAELLALIADLNGRDDVDGILVQLPVPPQINSDQVIRAIDPTKDVDGFHPTNVGLLVTGGEGVAPCTPFGCLALLKDHFGAQGLAGKSAVVVGRSNIVGKPMAQLLLRESCTVTMAHSRTQDLPAVCRGADILVAAVGQPGLVKADWIKPGGVVIDVGINRIEGPDGKAHLAGDVDFAAALKVASAITPVPGGVGPMTIAMLLRNTLAACLTRRAITDIDMKDV
ncbi:MAG: bifunctional methylenetetrahydrofolate dehydrogenase/methenyltetrahydrofolate cyclohydrolase [Alphaproteobacteria bacterium RIFOXYD12_FULL_60_8]|nr:MAG: bifunctional methylenetetrahydrofolate dehydrogenase/methenyltetrahydrofolate cyclohydrolase [Alphaproteobacteria bacterium RIFOXYD12_FULL_60_8]